MSAFRVLCVTLLVGAVAFALGGCEQLARGPMSIKRAGSHMLVAICTDMTVKTAYGEYKNDLPGGGQGVFLDLEGSDVLKSGSIESTGAAWKGMTVKTLSTPDLRPATSLEIDLTPNDPNNEISAAFDFGYEALSNTTWLHPNGSKTKRPC